MAFGGDFRGELSERELAELFIWLSSELAQNEQDALLSVAGRLSKRD